MKGRGPIPMHLRHLPTTSGGLPVPYVASWSSERWGIARRDPLVGNRWALFSEGAQGVGRPLLASINEERQRRSVIQSRCQVCDRDRPRDELWVTNMTQHTLILDGKLFSATHAPPTCGPCLEWSHHVCPAFRDKFTVTRFDEMELVLQFLDPSKGPMNGADRFDGGDNPGMREYLGRIARKNGGLVGHVKLAVALT